MATFISNTGISHDDGRYPASSRRNVLYLSTGGVVVVVYDGNSSTSPGGFGNGDNGARIYLYYSTTRDGSSFTRVATINPSVAMLAPAVVNADLYSDDSVGVLFQADAGGFRYVKVARAGWTVGAEEVAISNAREWVDVDLSIGGTVPVVSAFYKQDDGGGGANDFSGFFIFCRRSNDNTWVQATSYTIQDTFRLKDNTADITLQVLDAGAETARPVVVAAGAMRAASDLGVQLFTATLNEHTGNISDLTYRVTYDQNDLSPDVDYPDRPRKSYLFRSGAGEFILGIQTWYSKPQYTAVLGGWNALSFTLIAGPNQFDTGFGRLYGQANLTQTFGNDVLNFITCSNDGPGGVQNVLNFIVKINRTLGTLDYSSWHYWNSNNDSNPVQVLLGGSGRNYQQSAHDMVYYHRISSNQFTLFHHYASMQVAPHAVRPEDGSTQTTSTPPISSDVDLDISRPQSKTKCRFEFDTNPAFPSPIVYIQDDSHLQIVRGTDQHNVYVRFNDVLPASLALHQGPTWYDRSTSLDEFGNASPYKENTGGFTVSHAPSMTNLSPNSNEFVAYGIGRVKFMWTFTDPYDKDVQTGYHLRLLRDDTGGTVFDTGDITNSQNSYLSDILSVLLKGVKLKWQGKLADGDGVWGEYSDYQFFTLIDAASITITSPSGLAPVTTPRPNIVFGGTATPGSFITHYRVAILQAGTILWDTDWVPITPPLGGVYEITQQLTDNTILHNGENYTVEAQVYDSNNLTGTATKQFSTQWTTPAPPVQVIADTTFFNIDGFGYVSVTWADNSRDTINFLKWNVYRRIDTISQEGIVTPGNEELLTSDYSIGASYEFKDYFAPSGDLVNYRVTQVIEEFGDEVESDNIDYVIVEPLSDSYWLIDPIAVNPSLVAWRLSASQDSGTDEWDESEWNIIGRGRHVEVGDHLGLDGSLVCQLRDDSFSSARQKKQRIESLKLSGIKFYLRTPFGDVYWVHVGSVAFTRVPGVGHMEAIDLTIPYLEVSKDG